MRSRILSIAVLSMWALNGKAQLPTDSTYRLPDTVKLFSLAMFYDQILQHHPIAKQAALLPDMAKQELRLARGNFDPKLSAQYSAKRYDGTLYYSLLDASLKLPTRSPVTPQISFDRNSGKQINPQDYIPNETGYRQVSVGVAIPVGRGLLTDDRRTTLRQAQLFQTMMEAEKVKVINKLLLDAAKDYWQWYASYYNFQLSTNMAMLAREILSRTRMQLQQGEVAAVDTIQAKISLLEREVRRQESLTEWKNTTLKVSTYLWDNNIEPVDLPATYVPAAEAELMILPETTLDELVNKARVNHPELQKIDVKLKQLELERQLAREMMKPLLDVSYYRIGHPFGGGDVFWNDDNHKLGVDFAFPLFLRKERAKVMQSKIKLNAGKYERENTSRQIVNDVNSAYNELKNYAAILQQQRSMVDLYTRLMNAELVNLRNGESDLFKINIQQEKLYNAQAKLIKVTAEFAKQKALLFWAAGVTPAAF